MDQAWDREKYNRKFYVIGSVPTTVVSQLEHVSPRHMARQAQLGGAGSIPPYIDRVERLGERSLAWFFKPAIGTLYDQPGTAVLTGHRDEVWVWSTWGTLPSGTVWNLNQRARYARAVYERDRELGRQIGVPPVPIVSRSSEGHDFPTVRSVHPGHQGGSDGFDEF